MARKAAALSIIVIIIIIIIIIIIKIIENIVRMVHSLKKLSTEDSEVEDLFCDASFQLSLLATSDGRVLVTVVAICVLRTQLCICCVKIRQICKRKPNETTRKEK